MSTQSPLGPQQDLFESLECTLTIIGQLAVGAERSSSSQTPHLSPFPSHQSPSMKIATGNVRGAGNARFHLNVQDLINAYSPDILVILEPKISESHAEHVIGQVGLPRHFRVDPVGLSGGIWVLWDDRRCNVDVMRATNQSVAMLIRVPSLPFPWLFSTIYASPYLHKRLQLWHHLESLALDFKFPWLAMGDFNELLNSLDKLGGRPLILSRVHAFHSCLSNCGLFEVASSGPRCAWTSNNWDWRRHIRERLDRAFSIADWQVAFPKGYSFNSP